MVALEANTLLETYGGGQADVLAISKDGFLIETEVKVSLDDFRRDRNKLKHRHLQENDGRWPTHYFYFAVPYEIANKALMLCEQLYPYAGVLGTRGYDERDVQVYRQPRGRIAKKLSLLQVTRMAREQSATLCRLAKEVAELRAKRSG
ncbi:hypothetical protein ES703_125195 [subsurface metagenome]